ncbi:hypothetical protein [Pseudoalteromonas sp. MMG006]|uniref:hypothetical protein n=1 Tax=Pseudoalteromonas sp. MMG006 TaxID=2822683 RepID=UPI001B3914A6|nr:hypothetical protein [Pseudoalteromonas sp. MMG006]
MRCLFLTANDQVIDLKNVIAIENIPVNHDEYNYVEFTLITGKVIRSTHKTQEGAIQEKWNAYEKMKSPVVS